MQYGEALTPLRAPRTESQSLAACRNVRGRDALFGDSGRGRNLVELGDKHRMVGEAYLSGCAGWRQPFELPQVLHSPRDQRRG